MPKSHNIVPLVLPLFQFLLGLGTPVWLAPPNFQVPLCFTQREIKYASALQILESPGGQEIMRLEFLWFAPWLMRMHSHSCQPNQTAKDYPLFNWLQNRSQDQFLLWPSVVKAQLFFLKSKYLSCGASLSKYACDVSCCFCFWLIFYDARMRWQWPRVSEFGRRSVMVVRSYLMYVGTNSSSTLHVVHC
jgi:hypothetical protein